MKYEMELLHGANQERPKYAYPVIELGDGCSACCQACLSELRGCKRAPSEVKIQPEMRH